jgi:hypothetical protein
MIASIDYPIGHLLIVDNGASWVMEDMQIDVPDCVEMTTYLPMPANLGVAASWNLGIKLFPHDDRWFFASNDMVYLPGALESLSGARRDEITLSDMFPFWHTFSVGEEVVRRGRFVRRSPLPGLFRGQRLREACCTQKCTYSVSFYSYPARKFVNYWS